MHGPSFGQILGVAIGTAVTATVDRLLSLGYYVDGYDPDAVYLRDVNQWGYAWPYATMYYNNGCLTASQLIYSTPMADPGRYNNLYAGFCNAYGMPASTVQVAGGYTSTWFGPGQGYVELTYRRMNAAGGSMRFFTTVQFGR